MYSSVPHLESRKEECQVEKKGREEKGRDPRFSLTTFLSTTNNSLPFTNPVSWGPVYTDNLLIPFLIPTSMEWNLPPASLTHHWSCFWHYHQWLLIARVTLLTLINWPLCSIWHCWLLSHYSFLPRFPQRESHLFILLPHRPMLLTSFRDPSSDYSLYVVSFIQSFNKHTEHIPYVRYVFKADGTR